MKKTIGLKLGGCFLLTLAVLLLTSLYALNGVTNIRQTLEQITGEAWTTSENASVLSLNVNQGSGLLRTSLSYQEVIPEETLNKAQLHLQKSLTALESLNSGSYEKQSQVLSKLMEQFSALKNKVISEHTEYVKAIQESQLGVDKFNTYMKRLGFYSNYQISSLEDAFQRNQVTSWSGDVEDKWNFVITIYSSRIALGNTVTALQKQLQSSNPALEEGLVKDAMAELEEGLQEIMQSNLASSTINSGEWKGKSYSDAAAALLSNHKLLTSTVQAKQSAFLQTRDTLLTLVSALERHSDSLRKMIDAEVSEQTETAIDQANLLNSSMVASLPVGILLTLIAIWLSFRMVIRPVKNASYQMAEIATGDGDLSVRLPVKGDDEISELAQNFNCFVSRISETVSTVSKSSLNLVETSEALKNNSGATLTAVELQDQECEQAVASMAEINETVNDIANNASTAAQCSESIQHSTGEGRALVTSNRDATEKLSEEIRAATEVISNLAEESSKVGSIITVIQGIAEQTNLLALNAAIEAARAGDHGRGFAVVADEVRALSHSTQNATEEIRGLIDTLQVKASEAVEVMKGGQALAGKNVQ